MLYLSVSYYDREIVNYGSRSLIERTSVADMRRIILLLATLVLVPPRLDNTRNYVLLRRIDAHSEY
jgi:hypothetical protein